MNSAFDACCLASSEVLVFERSHNFYVVFQSHGFFNVLQKKVMNLFVVGGQPKKKKNTSQLKSNKIHQTHFLNLWLLLVIQFYSPLSTDKVVFDTIFFNLCGIHWKNYHHSPWCWWEWWIFTSPFCRLANIHHYSPSPQSIIIIVYFFIEK